MSLMIRVLGLAALLVACTATPTPPASRSPGASATMLASATPSPAASGLASATPSPARFVGQVLHGSCGWTFYTRTRISLYRLKLPDGYRTVHRGRRVVILNRDGVVVAAARSGRAWAGVPGYWSNEIGVNGQPGAFEPSDCNIRRLDARLIAAMPRTPAGG